MTANTLPERCAPASVVSALLEGPILVATDGTAQSAGAFNAAASIASRGMRRDERTATLPVHVITVASALPMLNPEMSAVLPADFQGIRRADMLAAAAEQVRYNVADAARWDIEATSGPAAPTITERAAEQDASLIVMGLGKHDLLARMFGSETALMVMQKSHVPVLAVPQNWIGIPRRVLIAVDFGSASLRAARTAMRIIAPGGTVCFAHVAPELGYPGHNEQITEIYQENLSEELDRFIAAVGVPADVTATRAALSGDPAPILLGHARANAIDMIVAGTHGLNALARLLVGSVAATLVRGAQCAVLVASAPVKAEDSPERPE